MSWTIRVYTLRESQWGKGLFYVGQGKSGNIRENCDGQGRNYVSYVAGQGRILVFIIKEILNYFNEILISLYICYN